MNVWFVREHIGIDTTKYSLLEKIQSSSLFVYLPNFVKSSDVDCSDDKNSYKTDDNNSGLKNVRPHHGLQPPLNAVQPINYWKWA